MGRVIGVVEDFHFDSLKYAIGPIILDNSFGSSHLIIHIKGEDIAKTLSFIEKKFAEFDLQHTFEYEFLDDSLNKLYIDEHKQMELLGIFAGICIFISCMGLFGLAAFTTEQRTKEIGIRKVLGASILNIVRIISNEFIVLVLLSNIIAWPLAWYVLNRWLEVYAYHMSINPGLFFIVGSSVMVVALLSVSYRAIRAARANPVDVIKYE